MEIARSMVNVLEDKKGEEILLIDLQGIISFADYFIICNGTSDRMLQALADALTENAHKEFQLATRVEGSPDDGWVLVDLGDVVVHLFSPDQREYYQLEKLWSKGKVLVRLQ
ncbi:MAG TPA: ribosome silencing factor [Anaerolinea sp.]|nr:ribosome silencing factor [Anaerolinea sp.]